MNDLIILTPSYNRADKLSILYESLKKQNNINFDWNIVDDGSTDNTNAIVEEMIKENIININYIYQANGGKARALNKGFYEFDYARIIVVVDSDDYLLPTAVETFNNYFDKYSDVENIGALFFHYKTPDGKILKPNGKIIDEDKIMTRYEYNNTYKSNDGCICYFNRVIKKYRYPEFNGEKYIGPTVIQMEMANEYKIVFSPKVVGVAEYLEDGLTKSGRLLRLNNPNGMLYYSKLMMSPKAKISTQIKYAISIWTYARLINKTFIDIIKMIKRPILLAATFIPGLLLLTYWKKSVKIYKIY